MEDGKGSAARPAGYALKKIEHGERHPRRLAGSVYLGDGQNIMEAGNGNGEATLHYFVDEAGDPVLFKRKSR